MKHFSAFACEISINRQLTGFNIHIDSRFRMDDKFIEMVEKTKGVEAVRHNNKYHVCVMNGALFTEEEVMRSLMESIRDFIIEKETGINMEMSPPIMACPEEDRFKGVRDDMLYHELERCIANEDYENAAIYRDEINRRKKE